MKVILICGKRGAGKTTLIRQIIRESNLPVYGYRTQLERRDEDGCGHVYMYPAGIGVHNKAGDNEVGITCEKVIRVNTDVFNGLGCALLGNAKNDGMIVMDEIGYMEENAEEFCRAVTAAFDGNIPVLASVKDTEHISRHIHTVLHHPKARVFMLDQDNRNEVYGEIKEIVREWEREINGKGEACEV